LLERCTSAQGPGIRGDFQLEEALQRERDIAFGVREARPQRQGALAL
jgi:hypothetical protein